MTLSARNILLSAAALAVAIWIGAVGVATVPPASYAGRWRHVDHGNTASLELFEDGSLSLTHVPQSVLAPEGSPHFDEPADWAGAVDVTGTWRIVGADPWFRLDSGSGFPVTSDGLVWAPTIVIRFGDPAGGHTFEFVRE